MTQLWTIIRTSSGEVLQPCCATPGPEIPPSECGEPWGEDMEAVAIAAAPDLNRMIWTGQAWVLCPQVAHDMQWQAAKDYSDARALTFFTMPGVGPIQTDEKSLTAIRLLVDEARDRIADGDEEWVAEFLNMDNLPVVVTAAEILAINRAVRWFFGQMHSVRQLHRAALKAALDGGEPAEAILAIDITAGYPA